MGFRVEIARTLEDVERLQPLWNRLAWGREEAEHEFFLTRLRVRPDALGPFAAFVLRDEEPVAGLVARVEARRLPTAVGYRVLYAPHVRLIQVVDGGIAVAEPAALEPLLDALRSALSRREADAIALPPLPLDSPLLAAFESLGGPLQRQRFIAPWARRRLVLPGTFEEFVASRSSNTRWRIGRDARRIEAELGEELSVRIVSEPDGLEQLVRDADRVARSTYQRTLGAGFSDTPEQRALAQVGLEHGWLRGYLLYRGADPIAYWLCAVHGDTILIKTAGFDQAYGHLRVGIYLLMRVVEDACRDRALRVLDFGPGDAAYKQQFSSESRQERNLLVFAPGFRGLRINAARTAILGSGRAVRRVLDAAKLTDRVRHRWRDRLRNRIGAVMIKRTIRRLPTIVRHAVRDLRYGGLLGGTITTKQGHLGAHDVGNAEYDELKRLFAGVEVRPDDVLVDVGCGKGRALNWFLSEHPRNRIYGIELDPEVCARTANRLSKHENVTVLCGDATELLPEDGTLFYLFNPFDEAVMARFAEALLRTDADGRRVVYYNCKFPGPFEADPRFEVTPLEGTRNHRSALVYVR